MKSYSNMRMIFVGVAMRVVVRMIVFVAMLVALDIVAAGHHEDAVAGSG